MQTIARAPLRRPSIGTNISELTEPGRHAPPFPGARQRRCAVDASQRRDPDRKLSAARTL